MGAARFGRRSSSALAGTGRRPCHAPALFLASLLLQRRLTFKTDRASVRRWALAHHLAPDTRYKKPAKPVRRWQASDLGALWQYDATPHAWLPGQTQKQVLLDILDDATRTNTGARLYPAETLLAHFDFLSRVFLAHGLPLALYVDYHSFFFTHTPDSFTALGEALQLLRAASRRSPLRGSLRLAVSLRSAQTQPDQHLERT